MTARLVLASTSLARRALLGALGIPFEIERPDVDERFEAGLTVEQAVALLAERKAAAVLARRPEALVIGADQLVSLDGEALGKPVDRAAARHQLAALAGRAHTIVTGVCLLARGHRSVAVETAELRVFPLAEDELERYLDSGEWEGCAGAYRVEGVGQALFESIDGDRTGVQGLPMVRLNRMLREAGYFVLREARRDTRSSAVDSR